MSRNYRNTDRDSEGQPIRFDTVSASVWVPNYVAGVLSIGTVVAALVILLYVAGRRDFKVDAERLIKLAEEFANWGWRK